MMKAKILILIAILLPGCTTVYWEDKPLKKEGMLFFSIADKDYKQASVHIDGEVRGYVQNGLAGMILKPGKHTLTLISHSTYTYSRRYYKNLNLNLDFNIEAGRVTSLGKLIGVDQKEKIAIFIFDYNDGAMKFTKQNRPEIYESLTGKTPIKPDLRYADEKLEVMRRHILNSNKYTTYQLGNIKSGELGALADVTNSTEFKVVDTGTLSRLVPLVHSDLNGDRYFITNLQELFIYKKGVLSEFPAPEGHPPSRGFGSSDWVITADSRGYLSFSNDLGETWKSVPTKLKGKWISTILTRAGSDLFFGPVTTDENNEYGRLVGYVIDTKTAKMKEIKWSKYVTGSTVFYNHKGTYYFRPINLDGNKTFLFRYNQQKDKWKEIKLPARACNIVNKADELKLECKKEESFVSKDGGNSWEKIL